MALKIVKNYDTSLNLKPEARNILFSLLTNETFIEQITQSLKENAIEFTNLLFQPVPYSQRTPKGMPVEYERYHASDDYIIINVPPSFMFQAKIFQPNRLCAIYRKVK
ncbi:hypothetical protein [Myxosarcina sp. GI1(2024)]